MKNRAGRIAGLVLGFAAALAVGVTAGSAKPNETVSLRMLYASGGGQLAMEVIVKNFERVYPNINVDVQFLPSDTITSLLLTQFQAGNAPDIFPVNQGQGTVDSIWLLAPEGRLLDLTGRPWQKRIYPGAKAGVTWKGKIYGWAPFINPFAAIYDENLFRQLGLKVPTRFSDLLAMCRTITAAGKVPIVQAWSNPAAAGIVGRQRATQYVYAVDPNWNDKRLKNQVTFASSPLWRRAIQSIVDMKDAGCYQPGASGTSRPQQYAMFASGQAVMSVIAASELTNFTTISPNMKITMFNLPGDTLRQSRVYAGPSVILSGNAATKFPAQVRTFFDFIAREQQSSLFAKVSGAIAPLDAKKGIVPAYMQKYLGPLFKAGNVEGGMDSQWKNPLVFDSFRRGLTGLFTGQTTIDSILAEMDRLWDTPR